jgi:hypothetical protein
MASQQAILADAEVRSLTMEERKSGVVALIPSNYSRDPPSYKSRSFTGKNEGERGYDVLFDKFNFSHLFSLNDKGSVVAIVMTPFGTIVGVVVDKKQSTSRFENLHLNVSVIESLAEVEQSLMSTLQNDAEGDFILMCKDKYCIQALNDSGTTNTSYFQVNDNSFADLPRSPVSYPLVHLQEIEDNYYTEDVQGNKVHDHSKYVNFLYMLKSFGEKADLKRSMANSARLDENIDFMQKFIDNVKAVKIRAESFVESNRVEAQNLVRLSEIQLRDFEQQIGVSEEKIAIWKTSQERLSTIAYNSMSLSNGLEIYSKFRNHLEVLDRDTLHLFFSIYTRTILSLEDEQNLAIREPAAWNLEKFLPNVQARISRGENLSVEQLRIAVSEDLARVDANELSTEERIIYDSFKQSFYA